MRRVYTIIIYICLTTSLGFAQLSLAQRDTLLALHNFYRQVVGSPPLSWSDDLASKAQQWAEAIASHPLITHNNMGYTQNLYYTNDTSKLYKAVQYWASEQIYYHGQVVTDSNLIYFRHYTAMIWKDSRTIGCGLARLPSGRWVLVCFYDPPGNIPGKKPVGK